VASWTARTLVVPGSRQRNQQTGTATATAATMTMATTAPQATAPLPAPTGRQHSLAQAAEDGLGFRGKTLNPNPKT